MLSMHIAEEFGVELDVDDLNAVFVPRHCLAASNLTAIEISRFIRKSRVNLACNGGGRSSDIVSSTRA